jgi:hypothetical protein
MFDEQRLGNDGTEASRPCKPDDGDNQMKKRMTTSRIQAWYQNPKKHLILAQFSISPWTGWVLRIDRNGVRHESDLQSST